MKSPLARSQVNSQYSVSADLSMSIPLNSSFVQGQNDDIDNDQRLRYWGEEFKKALEGGSISSEASSDGIPSNLSFDPDHNEVIDTMDPNLLNAIIVTDNAINYLKVEEYLLKNPIDPDQYISEAENFFGDTYSDRGSVDTGFSCVPRNAIDLRGNSAEQIRWNIERETKKHNALQAMIEAMESRNQEQKVPSQYPISPRPKNLLFRDGDGSVNRHRLNLDGSPIPIEVESNTFSACSSDRTSVMSYGIDKAKALFPKSSDCSSDDEGRTESADNSGCSSDDESRFDSRAETPVMEKLLITGLINFSDNSGSNTAVMNIQRELITDQILIESLKDDKISYNDISMDRDRKREPSNSPGSPSIDPFKFIAKLFSFVK